MKKKLGYKKFTLSAKWDWCQEAGRSSPDEIEHDDGRTACFADDDHDDHQLPTIVGSYSSR